MEVTVDMQIANLVGLIEEKYISTPQDYRPMDLGQKASFFTLDVISALAFGEAFGYLTTDRDVYDYLKTNKSAIPLMMIASDIPTLADILQSKVLRRLLPSMADKSGLGAFIGYLNFL